VEEQVSGQASQPDQNLDWMRVPATYVDYYQGSYIAGAGIVRLAFGEFAGEGQPAIMRSAIAMPISDVKILVRTLTEWVEAYDRMLAEQKR
jgi:hypothetical protein